MSDRYKSTKRCYLIDHHLPQSDAFPLDRLNIQDYRQFLETAKVDSQIVYGKDHWGLTYYPSAAKGAEMKAGVPRNWMKQLAQLLKDMDIEFIAYYCIEYDEGAARRFPEWRARQADGSPLIREDEFARWSLCCYESEYRAYCLEQIAEIVRQYAPDSLFLDIFGASFCHCENCRKKFFARFGYPMPSSESETREKLRDILDFLEQRSQAFLDEILGCIKAIDPSIALTLNFSSHYPKAIRDKLDFQFSEPLLQNNWLSAAYARDIAVGQYPMLAPGEASNVYNYKPAASYIAELSAIAAQGCRVGMYSGSQHADGSLDIQEARMLGAAYAEISKWEALSENRSPLASVAIVQSERSARSSAKFVPFHPDAILRAKQKNPHLLAILGAMRLCETLKLPYRIVPETDFPNFDLRRTSLVLLPELCDGTEAFTRALQIYIAQGGCVIASGALGRDMDDPLLKKKLFALFGLSGTTLDEAYPANAWRAFLKNRQIEASASLLAVTTPPVQNFYRVEAGAADVADEATGGDAADTDVLADFLLPSIGVDEQTWVNWWSPPPSVGGERFPAILCHRYKEGLAYYLAYDIFNMEAAGTFNGQADLLKDLIAHARILFPIRHHTAHPALIHTAYSTRGSSLFVHMLSDLPMQYAGQTSRLDTGELVLSKCRAIRSARQLYPQLLDLPIQKIDGEQRVKLPDIDIQAICEIVFAKN